MATALDLITDALCELGAVDPSEAITADEASHGLRKLNRMLDSWSNENLSCFQIQQDGPFSTVAGTVSYTVGSGAAWATTRPLKVLSAFLRSGSIDYPLRVLSREEYDSITDKSSQFMPTDLFYEPSMAQGRVYLYGVPDAVYTVYLDSYKQLSTLAALTTAVSLPPGYEEALVSNLAVALGASYSRKPPDSVVVAARESKAIIKRTNSRTPKLRLDHLELNGTTASDMAAFQAGYP